MTPDHRAWTEAMIAQWSARAAVMQEDPQATAGQLLRAACLEDVVARLRRLLAASPPPAPISPDEARIAQLEADQLACRPYLHPVYRIMFNEGPIMARVRANILTKLGRDDEAAELRAAADEMDRSKGRARPTDIVMAPPANDPEPFTAGPQMDMFG